MFCASAKNHHIAMSMLVSWENAKGKQEEFWIPFCKGYCINLASLLSTKTYLTFHRKVRNLISHLIAATEIPIIQRILNT